MGRGANGGSNWISGTVRVSFSLGFPGHAMARSGTRLNDDNSTTSASNFDKKKRRKREKKKKKTQKSKKEKHDISRRYRYPVDCPLTNFLGKTYLPTYHTRNIDGTD